MLIPLILSYWFDSKLVILTILAGWLLFGLAFKGGRMNDK